MSDRTRVLVVDDSTTARALLVALCRAEPGVEVVGEASDGRQAVERTMLVRPSIVVMDIEMPVMDGFEATKRIMIEHPTPILIVTARYDPASVEVSLRAVRAGALTVLPKPGGPGTPGFERDAARLVSLVKALADVKVVRARRTELPAAAPVRRPSSREPIAVVGVAASTGGPAAVFRFLQTLPRHLDVPVLVVQHIAEGFVPGLVRWLASATVLPVCTAEDGDKLAGGTVYVAPDGHHLGVGDGVIRLSDAPKVGGFRPSADVLFRSLADSYGSGATAVVLTGMGIDGVDGARAVRAAGGLVLSQDEGSSVVFGMPRAVADAGLADAVGSAEELAFKLVRFAPMRRG